VQRGQSRSWTVDDIVRELRGSLRVVTDALLALKSAGLVAEESEGQYRYRPADPELDEAARQLQQAYAAFPVAVAEAIYRGPSRQIRDFADAFRLKKD
jgi:DNA-binding transcriptional ArsR family regulator